MSFSEDPTAGGGPGEDPTQAVPGPDASGDPTQGGELGATAMEDPTADTQVGEQSDDDPSQGAELGSMPGEDPTA